MLALALALWPAAGQAQQRVQRLVLKDGTYQSVIKYEKQGDRVHYFSADRYEWEDVPDSLVDWTATDKYNAELSSGKLNVRTEESPEEREEREKEETNSPEIAPDLRLPGSGGVFLFDQFQGKPELAEILQNGGEVEKTSRKKNVLRAAINPLSGSKQDLTLKGAHAQIQSHIPRPTIYIDIDEGPQDSGALGDRFRLLKADIKNDTRVLGAVKVSFSGKLSQQVNFLPATVTKVGTGEWIKLTPNQDLAPGEYALIEMLSPQEMNLYLWDFGVNPAAPLNPNTWQPASGK